MFDPLSMILHRRLVLDLLNPLPLPIMHRLRLLLTLNTTNLHPHTLIHLTINNLVLRRINTLLGTGLINITQVTIIVIRTLIRSNHTIVRPIHPEPHILNIKDSVTHPQHSRVPAQLPLTPSINSPHLHSLRYPLLRLRLHLHHSSSRIKRLR